MESPDTEESDFEYFTPTTYDGGCLMGRKVKYPRRKRLSRCFVGPMEEKPILISACPCTEEDFEW